MCEWGTKKDENHPHPSLPRRGGGNNDAASRRKGIMTPHLPRIFELIRGNDDDAFSYKPPLRYL